MSGSGGIHVFIGAPTVTKCSRQEICRNSNGVMSESSEYCYFNNVQLQSLQSDSLGKTPLDITSSDCVAIWNQASSIPVCNISDRSVTKLLSFRRGPQIPASSRDSNAGILQCNYATPAKTEAITVLASTQTTVEDHNFETCQMKMNNLEKCSSPRFTRIKKDPSENSSCKRKMTFMHTLPFSSNQISKRPKRSNLSLQCVSKESGKMQPQTTVKPLTLLRHCSDKNKEYNILAVVLQPCHIKEIQKKNRTHSGSSYPLGSIVVLDQSRVRCKVLIWRAAAFWSMALFPGDIIMLTRLSIYEDKWNKETFLQSTFNSCFLNLGHCSTLIADEYINIVQYFILQELLNYIFTKHCYLSDLPSRPPQKLGCVPYVRLSHLQPETFAHMVLKVVNISVLMKCTYTFNELQQNKIILTVEEIKGQISTIILWGASVSWCEQMHMKKNHIWAFKYLFCKKSLISGEVELHRTPWSSCECLFDDDRRAIGFQKRYYENISQPLLMNLRTVIESKYSGVIQIKVSISELEFCVPENRSIRVSKQTCISKILSSLPLVIYTGCGKCRKELSIDSNHVYEQCFNCLPLHQVRLFYRPALITVKNEENEHFIHIPPDVVEKIFLNISPSLLHKLIPGSSNVTYGAIIADSCHSLLADNGESYLLTIKSHFSLDENSVPLVQEFHLLSLFITI